MKVNRDMVVRAGLKLLDEVGLEQLTLRRLGTELEVQAATIYWHFKNKEELIDEMATLVLAEGARHPAPAPTGRSGPLPSAPACERPCSLTATVPAWSREPSSGTPNT